MVADGRCGGMTMKYKGSDNPRFVLRGLWGILWLCLIFTLPGSTLSAIDPPADETGEPPTQPAEGEEEEPAVQAGEPESGPPEEGTPSEEKPPEERPAEEGSAEEAEKAQKAAEVETGPQAEPPAEETPGMSPLAGDENKKEELDAAKQAAMESVGKGGPTTQKAVAPGGMGPRVPGGPGDRTGAVNGRGGTPADAAAKPGAGARDLRGTNGPRGRPGVAPQRPGPGRPGQPPPASATPQAPTTPQPTPPPAAGPKTPPARPQPHSGAAPGASPATPAQPPRSGGRPGTPAAAPATTSAPSSPLTNTYTTMSFLVGPPDPDARTYRFDYDGTPWTDVLADFSRVSGLPWLNQPDPPLSDTLTFRSPRDFTYAEALDQLNELLLARPVTKYLIRRKDRYLTINRLPDLMREIPPEKMFGTFEAFEAAKLERFDICLTRFTVPGGWSAFQVIDEFRPMFTDTYGTEVVGENEIELTGLVGEHYRFRDVIKKLTEQSPPPPDLRPMLVLTPKVAKVVDLANTLKQLYPPAAPAPKTPGGPGVDQKADRAKQITILPEPKNNRLIIKAPNDILSEMVQMVERLDSGTPTEGQAMKVVRLEHASAMMIQTVLKPLFQQQKAGIKQRATTEFIPPEVDAEYDRDLVADPAGNSIILFGSKAGIEKAEALVKQWDVPDTNDVTEIIELKNAEAATVQAALAALLAPMAQKGIPPPRLAAQSSKKLLVSCGKNEIARIHELIDKLDISQEEDAKEHFVQLKNALPSVVAQTLSQLVGGSAPQRMAAPRPGAPGQPAPAPIPMPASSTPGGAKFIPDDSSGLLIVYCPDKDWQRIDSLINTLDGQASLGTPLLRSFELKNAKAADVANMLGQLFPAPAARTPGSASQLITVDSFKNAVKIFAKAEFIEKVAPFIEQLDVESEWPLTVIHLENLQADSIAPILLQTVGASGGAAPRMATPPAAPGQPPRPVPMPAATGGGGSNVRIVAEPITNSLLINAPPKELQQIQDLIAKMERVGGDKADTRVILIPEHRSAAELADTMQGLVGSGGPRMPRPAGPAGAAAAAAAAVQAATGGGAVKVVATGTRIILSGPQDEVAKAITLFYELDVIDQQAISRKYAVEDAVEDAKKLQALLGLSGPSGAPVPAAAPGAPGKPGAVPRPASSGALSGGTITIVPDEYANVILVRAMPKDFPEIEKQLQLIQSEPEAVPGGSGVGETTVSLPGGLFVHQLKHKKAWDIAWTVEELLKSGSKSSITLEEGPDEYTLIVKGCKPAQKDEVVKIIEMFDIPSADRLLPNTIMVESEKMPPEVLLRLIEKNYVSPAGTKLKVVGPGEEDVTRAPIIDIHKDEAEAEEAPPKPITIEKVGACAPPPVLFAPLQAVFLATIYDPPAGPLPPAVQPTSQPAASRTVPIVPTIDVSEPPAAPPPRPTVATGVQLVPSPTSAPATPEPAATTTSAPVEPQEVTALFDPETGKIIFSGPQEELDKIQKLIDELTTGKSPTVYRVFPLKYVEVNAAAQLLNNIFNQAQAPTVPQRQPRQGGQQGGGKNQPGAPGAPGAKGGEGGGKEGRQAQPQPEQAPAPAPAAGRLKVVPDARIRALYVIAPLSDIPVIVDVLKHIDKKMPPESQNIKIFKLVNLDASQVVQNLKDVLGIGGGARGPRQVAPGQQRGQMSPEQQAQMQQQMLQMQGQEGQGVLLTGEENVKLTAVTQTNSIIAQAPPDTLNLIETLIEDLEKQPDTTKQEMRRVPLVHARATDVATIVRDIASKVVPGAPGGAPGAPGAGGGARRSGAISVNADARTNSVILAGQVSDLDAVVDVVKELDIDDSRGSNIKQISVKGDAQAIATAIKSVFVGAGPQQAQDIIITADPSTATIVVKAPGPQMAEIEKQIADMDSKVAVEQQRRSVKMQFGDAESIAQNLQAIFADARSQRGGKQNIAIKGVKSNNTVYVTGADDEVFQQISAMAKDMDAAPSNIQVKAFPLKYASAVDVEQKLTAMMAKALQTGGLGNTKLDLVGVVSDVRTNSLIVTGGPVTFMIIDDVLKQVDVEPQLKLETKSYAFAPPVVAGEVARNINELFRDDNAKTTGVNPPTVTFNAQGNIVTVNANATQHEKIQKNVVEPLMKAVGEPLQDYQVPLKFARADEVKTTIEDFMNKWRQTTGTRPQDAFTITSDANANMLLINCSPSTKAVFDKQLTELDKESVVLAGERTPHAYVLKYANPQSVQDAINKQFTRTSGGKVADRDTVTTSIDQEARTIVVTANETNHKKAKDLIEMMDIEGVGDRITKAFTVKNVSPWTMATIITQQFQKAGRGPGDQVTASYEDGTRSIIVSASPKNMELVTRLINETDQIGVGTKETRFLQLKNARADDLVKPLKEALEARMTPDQRGKYPVSVTADPTSNSLIVTAPPDNFAEVERMVGQLDLGGGRTVHTVQMPEMIPAKSVAENVNKLFGGGSGAGGRKDGPSAEFHEPTNTLLVFATDAEFEKINEQVIRVLSEQPTIGALKIFKIPLKFAVADEVARTLQDFFDKKAGVQRQSANRPWWADGGSPAKQLDNQVTVMAEPASNMLIVYCTDTTKEIIDDLLKDIDTDEPPGGKKVMEMVALKYMDAAEMLTILTEYLKVSKRTQDSTAGETPWWYGGGRRNQQDQDKAVLAGDTRLTSVESLNAIIVVGKPETVQDVLAKITEMDVEQTDGANVPQTIKLVHASASELATTLDKTFNDPARKKSAGTAYVPPTIVAVEATNSLIVRAKPAEFALIKKMAEGLDSEMSDEPTGVRILPIPVGRSVEELADTIERQINQYEQNRKKINKDYKSSLVSIGADRTANALLIAASKAQYEAIKRMVDELVAMGPAGGTGRKVIKLKTLTPAQAKQLIEQFQQGSQGKGGSGARPSGGRSSGGPRSDADWTRNRRHENGGPKAKVRGTAYAATLPLFFTQVALTTAVAQTPSTQPATTRPAASQPKAFTINKVDKPQPPPAQKKEPAAPTTKPGEVKPKEAAPSKPAATQKAEPKPEAPKEAPKGPPPAGPGRGQLPPVPPPGKTAEEMIRATTQPAGPMISPEAQAAMRQRLSGAPMTIGEAGSDTIIFQGNDQDLEVIEAILQMLDTALPDKKIEYVRLNNSRAPDLAKTLADVFKQTEKVGERPVRPEDQVNIIADPRTNGLYIAATDEKMARALDLIQKNESAAKDIDKRVRSFTFQNRRVTEAGEVLKKMIGSYLKQMGLPADHITIELDPQTNSVLITGGEADLGFVERIIESLDAELPEPKEGQKSPMGQADIMVVPLRIAQADILGKLLDELLKKAATGDTPMKDFIRRMRLLDERGEVIAAIDLNRPIAIFGDKDSNSLIIASTKENCLIMKQIAGAFDREPARAEVQYKVVQLQYADADGLADQLGKFLKDSEELTLRAGGKGEKSGVPEGDAGSLVYKAVVKADVRTNQVMIVGRPEAVTVLEGMITSLDVKGLDVMPFQIIKLEYASASALETALTEMMKDRADALPKGTGPNADKAEKVVIKGDPRARSLIVAAKPARMEELRKLIKDLDVPSTALIEDIRTITVRKSMASDLADKLKKLWEDRQKQQESGSKGLKLEIPAIVADERSNSLIVAASKADFEAIKSVVDKIESLELNPMANIYVVRLKYNSAKQLSSAFQALFEKRAEMRTVDGKVRPEDKVAIEVDEVINALLVSCSRENYDLLMQKVAELDKELGVPGQVEFFVCDNVQAQRVKDTIDELFKEGVYKPGAAKESSQAEAREKVTVTIDDRSNILIVSASPENMELVREIYKRMNSVATPWDAAITKLIIVEHGDAVKIAAQVKDHFDNLDKIRQEGSSGKSKGGFGITVFADDRSNRIVVGGTKDGIDSAVDMIKKLDVPPGQPGQVMKVYTLREAPASKVGEMITNIFENRNEPRQGATGPQVPNVKVTVEPNDSSNSLLINASKEDHILIEDLVTRLDRPSALIDMVKVFPLERARSDRVKEILDELYQSAGGGDSKGRTIGVVEDKRTNAVVVAAPPGELDNIASLISRLDQTEVKGQAEVGVFRCENEDAKKMSELLNEIMTGKLREGGGSTGEEGGLRELSSMLISYAPKDPRGKELFLKAIRENVQISYSERTNSIIAVAPPSSLKLIEALVRQLDQIQKRPVLVKVFALVNSDAQGIVDLLEKMFAQDEGSEQEKEFQKGREMQVEGGASAAGGVPSAMSQEGGTMGKGTFGRPKTTFVAEQRTNSIIAAGWPEDIDVVADIIDQLDSRSIQDRENVVVQVVNKKAEDMQTALDSWVQAEQQRLDRLGDAISAQQKMDQEISVIAHKDANQLLVSVSPRYKSKILSIIEKFDQAPPQVMIQVMIAEVTLDDRFEMGMEFALQELRFSETAVAGGNGVLQSSHFDVVGGTDVGAAGSGLAGFSFTITGEDFNFLVRALQSDSRLEVIQRPMVMCQDKQTANITIGQRVPFVRGTQVTDNGQVTSQVEYEKVGIILDVEPQINPDGFVYLKVKPEVSAIASSTIDIGNGVLAPIFTERSAETTVAVKDGETVVIGGLITTTESEGESKVPFLGDLPGLGILFRSTTRSKGKTELLIALTPRIVRTVEDGRRLSTETRDEAGIITDEMKASPMFGKLRVTPESESEIPSIETPPAAAPPEVGPGGTPIRQIHEEPAPEPASEERYGPSAPRYGPQLPASEDAVARRDKKAA
jgi:type II secretion system protein D